VDLISAAIALLVLGLLAAALGFWALASRRPGLASGLFVVGFAAVTLIAVFFIVVLVVLDSA
jgi:hypothetical protein